MTKPHSASIRADYEKHGYVLAEKLFSEDEMDALMARAAHYVEHPKDGIRIQIEPRLAADGHQSLRPIDAVRKMEQLVAHDDLFREFSRDPRNLAYFETLLGSPLRLFRDALMWKPARVGSAKPYHQDSAYWSIAPMSLCSVWVALEDATLENGCMRVIPGSHTQGIIEHHHLEDFMVTDEHVDLAREVALEMPKGSALFFHSLLLHATSPNTSEGSRRAMILSCMGPDHAWTGKPEEEPEWLVLG